NMHARGICTTSTNVHDHTSLLHFSFLMIPPPPRSTLFPYTTLFRSSVTERTREIGIRMAVGARGNDILLQFLTEAVTLSIIGGVIGIGAGMGVSKIIEAWKHWPVATPLLWILASFLVSAAVGIFFGFYPARKASQL